ncbi:hypothetical protein GCM10010421_10150 [Streptomyces glaucus]|uniref:Transposase IS4-like domain-containing protein n=1 Tax=Streptomyces glaucus TaxID=284029 RepID=A0ABN3JCL1_9ACTN
MSKLPTPDNDRRHPTVEDGHTQSRQRPDRVVTDKGYSVRSFRAYLHSRGTRATVPNASTDRRDGHGDANGHAASPGPLPPSQRRRTLLPSAQAMARHRHPLRYAARLPLLP